MRPLVITSIEDVTGQRCVDIVQTASGFGISECRRDPEDASGWARLAPLGEAGFDSAESALAHARATIGWLT